MTSEKMHRRIDAIGIGAGDAVSATARELLRMYDEVYHSDMLSLYGEISAIKTEHQSIRDMISAIAATLADVLIELRTLREEVQAWRGGFEVELGELTVRVVGLEARESESSRP